MPTTEIRVVLVPSEKWLAKPDYVDAVGGLERSFAEEEVRQRFPNYSYDSHSLDVEDEGKCVTWLLATLADFFRDGVKGRIAYVDTTSAPKEWLFSCNYVASFFDSARFYYTRARRPKSFADFEKETTDTGLPSEPVSILPGPDATLVKWVTEGTPSNKLFKCICQLAAEKARADEIPVTGADVRLEAIATEMIKTRRGIDWRRSLGKHLSNVERFRLFERKPKTIFLTSRGYALGRSLFPDVFRPEP